MKKTQKQFVVKKLNESGFISRNECLRNYISRLSAIIYELRQEGWEFLEDYVESNGGKDFLYKVTKSPLKKIERFVPELNKTITTWE